MNVLDDNLFAGVRYVVGIISFGSAPSAGVADLVFADTLATSDGNLQGSVFYGDPGAFVTRPDDDWQDFFSFNR